MKQPYLLPLTALAVALGLWLWPQVAQAQSTSTFLPVLANGEAPLCRFGVNGAPLSYPIEPLRIGWYVDYQATKNAPTPGSMKYFPMLRLEQIGAEGYSYSIFGNRATTTVAQLNAVIDANPGTYWFIGNEPDRIQFQDDMEPRPYAKAYHDLYYLIKGRDPSAKIVAGAIVQPTPIRLQYLDLVLSNYQQLYQEKMPVDVWAFHNFILNEASCTHYAPQYPNDPNGLLNVCWGADIPPGIDATDGLRIDVQRNDDIELFKEQVVAFRMWMADNGYRNVPVFLSEYGILMPQGYFVPDFTSARVNAYMTASFDYLLNATDPNIGYPGDGNRLVQRFSWYSVEDNRDHNGFLFDNTQPVPSSRTEMGNNFRNYTSQIERKIDFFPMNVRKAGQNGASVTLQVDIHNSGNLGITSGATVRFFNGDPANGGTQIGSDQSIRLAGCGQATSVTATWENATSGNHDVYVAVSTNKNDLDAANNVASASINVSASQ